MRIATREYASPFSLPLKIETKKPLREKWLNYLNLKLKFGGPCWT